MTTPTPLTSQQTELIEIDDSDLLTGYRGLNQTFIELVGTELKKDPFVDISSILSQYQNCRDKLKERSSTFSSANFDSFLTLASAGNTSELGKSSPPNVATLIDTPLKLDAASSVTGLFTAIPSFSTSEVDVGKTGTATSSGSWTGSKTSEHKARPSNPPSFPFASAIDGSFTFGAKTSTSTNAFSFGNKTVNKRDPVGFIFGAKDQGGSMTEVYKPLKFASSKVPATLSDEPVDTVTTTFATSSAGKAFVPLNHSLASSAGSLTPVIGPSREETPLSDAATTMGDHPGEDEIYEGEEDETIIHSVKAKISKLIVNDGKAEWKSMGVGLLKLKQKQHEPGIRRILHRDTASKRIIINSRLFRGFSVTLTGPRLIKLGTIEDGKTVQYLCRVSSEKDANDLKAHIEDQITSLD